jgi:hypothetical protein
VRLRPILMTSLATMASAVPLALGYGPGAETRAPLARSIIGGIFLSTLVTLVIVPIFYVLFDRFGDWVRVLARRGPKAAAAGPPEANGYQPPHGPVGEPANGEAPAPRPEPDLQPALEVRPEPAT